MVVFHHSRVRHTITYTIKSPGFEQYVQDTTRKNNILDKCYVNIKNAYVARVGPPISTSDHKEQLKACLDLTDWDTFSYGSLDEITTVTNDYINFCVELVVPTKEIKIYPNNKSYVTKDIQEIIHERKTAFINKDFGALKLAEKKLKNRIKQAKSAHRQRLEDAFNSNNHKKTWDTMKSMTGMSSPSKPILTENEGALSNDLNTFFARFESLDNSSKCTEILKAVIPAPSDRITITEEDVRRVFRCTNTGKANGPDECSAFLLKNFASELAPVWQPIFQTSVDTHTIPLSWKTSYIKPLPKIRCPKEHKDYRPIALTSVIMKSLERILLQYLVSLTKEKLDPCQFAYKKGCGTEDAVATLFHLITKHLDQSKDNYARVLFLDFSSAFNTIQSDILVSKMVQLELNPYLIHWYAYFLTNMSTESKGEQNPFLSINYKCWRSTGLCKLSCTLHSESK
jgi:hypothetical protein